jgi:steroid delta-isomerase
MTDIATADVVARAIDGYLDAYNRNDRDAFLALFADDAVVEDPVGTPPHTGRDAIAGFWDTIHSLADSLHLGAAQRIVCGGEAAVVLTIEATMGGQRTRIHAVDTFRVLSDGRISEVRAYWDLAAAEPVG